MTLSLTTGPHKHGSTCSVMTLSPSHTPLTTSIAAFPLTQPPSQAELRELFDYDPDGFFVRKSNGIRVKSTAHSAGYRTIWFNGKNHKAHRLIYQWHHSECPAMLDHINRNRADNRIENLRPATNSTNQMNRKRTHLTWLKKKETWMIQVTGLDGKRVARYRKDKTEALNVAADLRKQLQGEFAFDA